jgi:hypothetical protein
VRKTLRALVALLIVISAGNAGHHDDIALAELVGVAQPGRARVCEEPFAEDQVGFLKRQLSLPVSTMSQ